MTNKLYVANLPSDTTEHALRRHFAACGGVADVELRIHRATGKLRGDACVTMTSETYASEALAKLDGVDFEGSKLRVSDSPRMTPKVPPRTVKMVQQFRERGHMVYDLDCSGTPLTVRVGPADGDDWMIEARSKEGVDAFIIARSGRTRRDALASVVLAWNEQAGSAGIRPLDGDGLLEAMLDVRAV